MARALGWPARLLFAALAAVAAGAVFCAVFAVVWMHATVAEAAIGAVVPALIVLALPWAVFKAVVSIVRRST